MKIFHYAVFASALLIAAPASGAEIDCPPELETILLSGVKGAEELTLDEDLKQKRKKAREDELARAKARFMQQVRSAQAEPAEQPGPLQ